MHGVKECQLVKSISITHGLNRLGGHSVGGALEHTLEHFRAVVQSSADAIITKTLDGLVTSWNPGAESIFGYTEQEMLGKSLLALFPPDRMTEETQILEQVLRGSRVEDFDTERLHKSGKRLHVSVIVSPIRDRYGIVVGASKIARDITFQKMAEAQLRLTANVFTHTSEGILIVGSDGLITDVNNAFTRITGYTREGVTGKSPQIFRSSRRSLSVFRRMRRALQRFGEWKGEIWSRRPDGKDYSVLLTVCRVCDGAGEIKNYIVLLSDITSLKLQQEQLEHGAHFDTLTNLPNRMLLSDRLHQAMVICQRQQRMLAVLYLDIDGFKFINDNYGHATGDELLVAFSLLMRAALREGDTLARMGGDEFVVVLTGLGSVQDCIELVNRLLATCARPVEVNGNVLSVTTSIGVTLYPNDDVDADQLIRHADYAMYEAKRAGKNRFNLFDAVQDVEVKNRSILQSRIAQGLHQHEFALYYQPKVNMRTGAVVGVEALIRWQHPDHGLLLPGTFLPLIEKNPLCEQIGAWVLESAIQQLDAWRCVGLQLPVSINISARQFQDESFASKLAELLAKYLYVVPANVELEILETSALEDMVSVQKIMRDCHALGVHFSLDDFGTGYSSLTYLARLPVSTLKIDQSFIRDMLVDAGNSSIVKGVIGLAEAFNRKVIAEGVETTAHGTALLSLGCEWGQGYAIARPMAAEQIPAWVSDWQAPRAWTDGQDSPGTKRGANVC